MKYIKKFADITIADIPIVGGKTASLGQMFVQLAQQGIQVPNGFAITAHAYQEVIEANQLHDSIVKFLHEYNDNQTIEQLKKTGEKIRNLFLHAQFPEALEQEIAQAYQELSQFYHTKDVAVAVRSSATAEDLPEASFAGQQESFLNVIGVTSLLQACKKSMASLFTDRAIVYRKEKKIDDLVVSLAIAVQKMVHADSGSSGVIFTLEPETGFKELVVINSAFGLGEIVVQGTVNPDEFWVYKPMLEKEYEPIIKKQLGEKNYKIVFGSRGGTTTIETSTNEKNKFSLSDQEILALARMAVTIEQHYSQLKGHWQPMDIEWAKDGIDQQLYIVQARPETVHSARPKEAFLATFQYKNEKPAGKDLLVQGQSVGNQVVSGIARVIKTMRDVTVFNKGDILVAPQTDPDWVPLMKQAAGIVTDRGGRTSHAAIVSRELGIPAVVGTNSATHLINDGQSITIDCSQSSIGFVYNGSYAVEKIAVSETLKKPLPIQLFLNIADPDRAIPLSMLPVNGVGLARIEFIITHFIKMHPMAAIAPQKVTNKKIREQLRFCARAYSDEKSFFVDTLACGIATIAAAFYPRFVLVRLSDFKSNEYRNLIGGTYFEPVEENPMLGLRGASRYYNDRYAPAFALECAALKKVREQMGLTNVHIMIPFIRTVAEAQKVITLLGNEGLIRGKNDLLLYMMCEIPSNVLLIDSFSTLFDGISIGSNDLTQMTLAVDRDSQELAALFDERDEAVKVMMKHAVEGARRNGIKSGICGQAPSDYPEIARFLIGAGIDSISLNPDALFSFISLMNNGFGALK